MTVFPSALPAAKHANRRAAGPRRLVRRVEALLEGRQDRPRVTMASVPAIGDAPGALFCDVQYGHLGARRYGQRFAGICEIARSRTFRKVAVQPKCRQQRVLGGSRPGSLSLRSTGVRGVTHDPRSVSRIARDPLGVWRSMGALGSCRPQRRSRRAARLSSTSGCVSAMGSSVNSRAPSLRLRTTSSWGSLRSTSRVGPSPERARIRLAGDSGAWTWRSGR